jgi:crossover junction endodeoxyribonuclease RuvC
VKIRVLGIDPGLRNMGWGIIDVSGPRISHVANGVVHSEGDDMAQRLLSLHVGLTAVVTQYQPQTAAVEQTFVNKVKKTVVGVGHADKGQVLHMVKLQLPGALIGGPDAADALAIAICHAHHGGASGLATALEKAIA